MKAFLLAAGHGTRLKPLTDNIPKCLLPVCGVPMLQIWLETCQTYQINEILINVHAHADAVNEYVKNHSSASKVRVIVEPTLLGSAGTLFENRNWVSSEESFWVFYADVLNRINLGDMLKLHRARNPAATIAAYRVPDPERCGIIDMGSDGTVLNFVEKPAHPASNLAFAGILIGTPELLEAIPPKLPADIGFDVLPQLAGRMIGYEISEYLLDIGTLDNYQLAQTTWK